MGRGKLRKRVWIGVGDIILLGLREFQDQKADIILKYDGDEARSLKTYGELPDTVQIKQALRCSRARTLGMTISISMRTRTTPTRRSSVMTLTISDLLIFAIAEAVFAQVELPRSR